MKVLFLANHLNIGGISSYLLGLSKGLKERGHRIYLAAGGGKLEQAFAKSGINFIPIPLKTKSALSPKIIFSFFRLSQLFREEKIDIVHANTRVSCVLADLLHRAYGVEYLSTCHGFFKAKLLRRLFPFWGKLAIAISSQVREHLINDFGLEPEKIRLIHNGVEPANRQLSESEIAAIRDEFGLKDGPLVGIIARLSDVKGHKFLIAAMRQVLKTVPAAQLIIVGEGKERNNLISQVRREGMERNTIFIPSLEDTSRILAALDLFVMPSLQEGLGLSIIEAMAQGLPVIASDIGGIRSVIKNDFNGRLVMPRDAMMLSGSILELLNDKDKAETLGANARKSVAEKFSCERMVSETERIYLECLSANS